MPKNELINQFGPDFIDCLNKNLTEDTSPLHLGSSIETVLYKFNELSPDTFNHCKRVGQYSEYFGKKIKLTPVQTQMLFWGGHLHDLGKLGDVLLLTEPDKLSIQDRQFFESNSHQEIGHSILVQMHFPKEIINIVKNHHVNFYHEADLMTNIIRVFDRFDILINGRFGQIPTDPNFASQKLNKYFGVELDPGLQDAFKSFVKDSFIELE